MDTSRAFDILLTAFLISDITGSTLINQNELLHAVSTINQLRETDDECKEKYEYVYYLL